MGQNLLQQDLHVQDQIVKNLIFKNKKWKCVLLTATGLILKNNQAQSFKLVLCRSKYTSYWPYLDPWVRVSLSQFAQIAQKYPNMRASLSQLRQTHPKQLPHPRGVDWGQFSQYIYCQSNTIIQTPLWLELVQGQSLFSIIVIQQTQDSVGFILP